MSEVSDACQIILVTGKGAYYLGEITARAAGKILKVMETVYLSKWEGMTSLTRFRAIKGDNFTFVNIATEDRTALSGIFKEMEAHGILLARLPDLCGGDGRTQIVTAPSDAAKFEAFLLDHAAGKYKDIRVGKISEKDYARTGFDEKGKETEEFSSLTDSALETLREQKSLGERKPAGLLRMQKAFGTGAGKEEPERKETPYFPITSPKVLYALRNHDETVQESAVTWMKEMPLKEHEKWGMYELPDGVHAVVIPNRDRYEFFSPEGEKLFRAALFDKEFYNLINLATGEMTLVGGEKIAAELNKPTVRTENEELKNLEKNLGIKGALPKEPDNGKEMKEEPFTPAFTLSLSEALSSGTVDLPLEYRLPDDSEKGYQSHLFSASEAEVLPGTDFIRIPLTGADQAEEILTVNARESEKEGLLRFADPAGRYVALTIPGDAEAPDLLVHVNRGELPEFTVNETGQEARLFLDPAREYEVSFKTGGADQAGTLSGEEILTRVRMSEEQKSKEVPLSRGTGSREKKIFRNMPEELRSGR